MRSFIYSFVSFNRVALILLILGRAPLLKVSSYVCVFGKQMVQHVWKVVAPALISVGPINAQTGATDEVIELDLAPGFDDTTGFVGEHLDVRVLADGFVPQSYTVDGKLPPGIELTDISQYGVGIFSGIPTKAGIYNVFVTGWEEREYSSPGSDHLEISFYIRESGRQITRQPTNQVVDWGDVLTLSVLVRNPENVSYQWKKDGKPILNANAATLQIIQATSADSGVYQVVTSNELGETVSDDVFGFVTSSELQKWREETFVDPFDPVADPTADPDLDGKPNNLEFVLGEDPLSGITLGYPKVSYQELEGLSYLVCEFKENPFTSDVVPLLEKKTDLSEAEWRPVNLEETSIIVEEPIEHFRLFILIDGPTFLRLRLIAE